MLMNRVKEVKALPNYRLAIVFRNGEKGIFDCNPYRGYECLSGIWADGVFDKVVADHGTVMWPNGADLCPDEVYDNSVMNTQVSCATRRHHNGAKLQFSEIPSCFGQGNGV